MIQSKNVELPSEGVSLRSREKEKLGQQRLQQTKRFVSTLTKSKYEQGYLSRKSYLCFLIQLQMPLHYIMLLFDLVLAYGAALVLCVYMFLMCGFGMPMFMLFIFMGRYCRKGYFRYWQCVPLLKGAGYTIALMTITPEFINAASAGLSLLYINDMFDAEIPWVKCDFERVTNTCLPMVDYYKSKPALHCTDRNSSINMPIFSALNYLRFNKQNQYPYECYDKLGSIKKDWAISVALTWILIFVFMIQGFQNFQKVLCMLQICAGLLWLVIFISTLRYRRLYQRNDVLFYGVKPAMNIEFWWYLFMHVCDRNQPDSVILLSSMVHSYSTPNIDAIIVNSFKFVTFTFLIVWVPILLQNVLGHYNIAESGCMVVSGFEVVFAVIPDVLSRMDFAKTWIAVWFVCIYIHAFSSVLYTCTGAVDSLIDAYPAMVMYRLHICAILCISSSVINLIFVTRLGYMLMSSWTDYGMVVLRMIVFALVTFALTFIYSITRLVNDYYFAYGEPPIAFWVQSWKVTPFLVLFETVFTLYRHHGDSRKIRHTTPMLKLLSYVTAILMLLPIFCVMLWKYCKHVKYQMVSSIVRPESGWGYYNVFKSLLRKHFNPQREVRYKTNKVKCKHSCLVNSKKLKRLQQTVERRKNSLILKKIDAA